MRQVAYWAPPTAAMQGATDVTRLLGELARGNREVEATLIPLVYDELRRVARALMRGESRRETLQTTALVHEAYLRLTGGRQVEWESRTHFLAVAAKVMRRILVDHARARNSEKRGGGAVVSGAELMLRDPHTADSDRLLALDAALERLAALDGRQAQIVEMRFFAGMTVEETAHALGISPRTVKREWQMARAWLYGELVDQ
jgi:RNA polymerase sigma factor (TIGR02999 family)